MQLVRDPSLLLQRYMLFSVTPATEMNACIHNAFMVIIPLAIAMFWLHRETVPDAWLNCPRGEAMMELLDPVTANTNISFKPVFNICMWRRILRRLCSSLWNVLSEVSFECCGWSVVTFPCCCCCCKLFLVLLLSVAWRADGWSKRWNYSPEVSNARGRGLVGCGAGSDGCVERCCYGGNQRSVDSYDVNVSLVNTVHYSIVRLYGSYANDLILYFIVMQWQRRIGRASWLWCSECRF